MKIEKTIINRPITIPIVTQLLPIKTPNNSGLKPIIRMKEKQKRSTKSEKVNAISLFKYMNRLQVFSLDKH